MPFKMMLEGLVGFALVGGLIFLLTRKLWKPIGNGATKQIEKFKEDFSDEPKEQTEKQN